ncbi:deaminase, putative [Trypanosoma brucei gambiense DAL972]|uniref:Deaminase, putative n=1 Tax=Trypanosoma brucei gambiense (strain MHOM/CI/86/DAL972) TaxID=679716 RepID=D0AA95_TRYB9|nr:deaminase, putative [Trypanosoma brucei gambiense DAL972]CBH18596.1 deaminase, putative [Trypanosoma brucei gambiense DAL972]|eukprot:XP_011780860.1 deaminase, putative [Trypanosoma brucei gambiense DAL972]
MEEVVVPEEPPKLVSALATYVQQERLCTMFLSIANKLLPLKPHACHLKRIRRSSATRVATAPMDGFAGGVICDKRDSSVATSTISDGCERNSAALGTPAAEKSHVLELLLSVGGPVDSSALKELESAADTTVAVHRVWVPDRAPRSSAEEWTKWCQIWPFATPKPRVPTQLSECEVGSIQRIFRTVVMPLAKRLRTDETLGIAAVLVDPSDGYRVLVSSGEEHALKRGNSAACLGYVSNSGCRKSNRVVLDHPVTFVLKEVTRKQCKDREVEGDASYLANGMDMFVSHEPCVMCSMALVHSRVRRVFYCFPNPVHGGLGSTVSIHAIQELNHHFRVFRCDSRWLSDPEGVSSDHDNPYWEDLTVP